MAVAQPDAGALRQQIEQGQMPPLPREALPEKPAEPVPLTIPDGVTVTVQAFRFAGNTLLSADQLTPVVAPYLDRPLNLVELRQAAAAVARAYRAAGWVVRAYLPKQEIDDGIVIIQIVEAVFGGAVIDGEPPKRLAAATLLGMVDKAQPRGAMLNSKGLDRVLLLIDDLPGVAVTGNLRSGQQQGETELALKLADEPLTRFELGADNTGSRSTGPERLLANLALNSPLGRGDLLAANYLHTKGSNYLRVGFTAPLGQRGWRVGLNGSLLDYRLVAPEFSTLNGEGLSTSLGLEANYPIIRSKPRNLYLRLNLDNKTFDNEANGATTTDYRVRTAGIGLVGNLFDKLGGGGANVANLALTLGEVDLGTLNISENARLNGGFSKLRYSLSRQQVITPAISLYAGLSGQWTPDNLDSSEKFYLGGAHGVRAYPASEAGGATAQMINLEVRARLPKGFTLIPFYDWGQVRVNVDNDFAGAANPNSIILKGAGLSLGWQGEKGLLAKLTWAHRQGDNPNPTATGKDQDGSLVSNRIWASIMMSF